MFLSIDKCACASSDLFDFSGAAGAARDGLRVGVQFHPESLASERGPALPKNFLAIARGRNEPARAA